MHRTQISLERQQYEFLIHESRRRGVSLSDLIRQLVNEQMQRRPAGETALDKLAGMAEGTGEPVGRGHDRFLYGEEKK